MSETDIAKINARLDAIEYAIAPVIAHITNEQMLKNMLENTGKALAQLDQESDYQSDSHPLGHPTNSAGLLALSSILERAIAAKERQQPSD